MTNIHDIFTIKEASVIWNVPRPTLAQACTGQRGYPPKFTENECRKSEGTWLITRSGMERVYGKEPK